MERYYKKIEEDIIHHYLVVNDWEVIHVNESNPCVNTLPIYCMRFEDPCYEPSTKEVFNNALISVAKSLRIDSIYNFKLT